MNLSRNLFGQSSTTKPRISNWANTVFILNDENKRKKSDIFNNEKFQNFLLLIKLRNNRFFL